MGKLDPAEILEQALVRASANRLKSLVKDKAIRARVDYVGRCLGNRAGVRLLMACLLAKVDRSEVDPRKPYTEIGTPDAFSGRPYDEAYLTPFINRYRLPCNPTTAFLTPALRNIDRTLTTKVELVGRPRQLYVDAVQLLEDVRAIGFLRHFLHFFHRLRIDYLDAYQALVLAEPDSAVNQPLKEAFLALRQSAESDE